MFNYQRELKEKMAYSVTMNKGSIEDKKSMSFLDQMESNLSLIDKDKYLDVLEDLSIDNIPKLINLVEMADFKGLGLLESKGVNHYDNEKIISLKKRLKRR